MNEKKEALRIEILKYIEKHRRVDLGELGVLMGASVDTTLSSTGIRPGWRW